MEYVTFFLFILSVCNPMCVLHLPPTSVWTCHHLSHTSETPVAGGHHAGRCTRNALFPISSIFLLKLPYSCWLHSSLHSPSLSVFSVSLPSSPTLCLLAGPPAACYPHVVHQPAQSSTKLPRHAQACVVLWVLPLLGPPKFYSISKVYITGSILRQTCTFHPSTCALSLTGFAASFKGPEVAIPQPADVDSTTAHKWFYQH